VNASAYLGIFLVGLLGGVHCLGMCGGIASAMAARPGAARAGWPLQLAFNLGRIGTYGAAGALAGGAGALSLFVDGLLPVQLALYLFANLMLIALGLYLLGVTRYVMVLERGGARLWKRIAPWTRHVMPADTVPRALALGMLWGWLPCGLVYSVLATALLAGDAAGGAAVMLAFGLGTLPNLLFAGVVLRWLAARKAGRYVRAAGAAFVLAMGLLGLLRLPEAGTYAAGAMFCFTPAT